MKKYVLNKHGKFGIKMFLLYTDITIFTLGHFILLHPVLLSCMNQLVGAKLWCLLSKAPVYLSNCCIPVSQVASRRHLPSTLCCTSSTDQGGKVICVPVALPASTLANTPAEGNQRFHLRTTHTRRTDHTSTSSQHLRSASICCHWSDDV